MAQLGAGLFERGVSDGDRDVVLRGPEGGRERAARCRRFGWRSPPAVHARLRCSHDSMADTGTEAPVSGKRAAERGAERGRGVKRSSAPPAASEELDGQSACETGRRDLPCGSKLGRANWGPPTRDSTPGAARPGTSQEERPSPWVRHSAHESGAAARSEVESGRDVRPVLWCAEQDGPELIRVVCLSGDSCLLE